MPTDTADMWRESLPVNRLARCFAEEAAEVSTWAEVEEDPSPDREAASLWMLRARLRADEPVGSAVGKHAFVWSRGDLSELIESIVAEALAKRLDALVEKRVDALLAERTRAKRAAEDRVNDLLRKLRAKSKATDKPVSLEEAWSMVDLSTFRDDDVE